MHPPPAGDAVSFGLPLKLALIGSIAAFFGYVILFLVSLYLPPTVLFLASLIALIVAPVAVTQLLRRRSLRSRGNVLLTISATVVSLPALAVALYFLFLFLPLTSSERDAIASAEAFVLRNGYTAAGHPRDLPVVANDITDRERTSEEIVNSRRGQLQPRAFGIVGARLLGGYNVLFEYARPNAGNPGEPRNLFVVHIEPNGEIVKLQTMPTYPDWYIKRNAR